ncbi:hypothetical protein CTI12_AA552240 [Artemisia annua]|uniref:RNA-directed DNA polymerase, eukaryota, Reverse transcriptase zinc-binding domain protein n=1 Tax=Artemisia annua TaxID=35608 RepID=A0A2U1KY60_ARTAN|nr:hypothetical protein CTI12_AA552240 [Artemisia annua]
MHLRDGWADIVIRYRDKLSAWKAKLLESIRARFFWGFKDGSRGISWVKWNSILVDRNMGGLGVGSLLAKNLGLLGKWKWRFLVEKDALWRIVIREFYVVDVYWPKTLVYLVNGSGDFWWKRMLYGG